MGLMVCCDFVAVIIFILLLGKNEKNLLKKATMEMTNS